MFELTFKNNIVDYVKKNNFKRKYNKLLNL